MAYFMHTQAEQCLNASMTLFNHFLIIVCHNENLCQRITSFYLDFNKDDESDYLSKGIILVPEQIRNARAVLVDFVQHRLVQAVLHRVAIPRVPLQVAELKLLKCILSLMYYQQIITWLNYPRSRKQFFHISSIHTLISGCMCFTSYFHRWHGQEFFHISYTVMGIEDTSALLRFFKGPLFRMLY